MSSTSFVDRLNESNVCDGFDVYTSHVEKSAQSTLYIELIDSSGLNYIMFTHNSVALRN